MLPRELWSPGAEEERKAEADAGGHQKTELQKSVPEGADFDPLQL